MPQALKKRLGDANYPTVYLKEVQLLRCIAKNDVIPAVRNILAAQACGASVPTQELAMPVEATCPPTVVPATIDGAGSICSPPPPPLPVVRRRVTDRRVGVDPAPVAGAFVG